MQCPVGDRHHLKRFPVIFEGIVVMKIRVASEQVLCSFHHQQRVPYFPQFTVRLGERRVTYQAMQLVRCLKPHRMSDKALLRIVPVCMPCWVDVRLLGLLFRHQNVTGVFFRSFMLALRRMKRRQCTSINSEETRRAPSCVSSRHANSVSGELCLRYMLSLRS